MLSAESFARYRAEVDRVDVAPAAATAAGGVSVELAGATGQAGDRAAGKRGPRHVSACARRRSAPQRLHRLPRQRRRRATAGSLSPRRSGDAGVAKPAADTHGGPAELKAIRRTVLPDVVRIAIELDREVEYHSDQIDDPDRVFVDLRTTSVAESVERVADVRGRRWSGR